MKAMINNISILLLVVFSHSRLVVESAWSQSETLIRIQECVTSRDLQARLVRTRGRVDLGISNNFNGWILFESNPLDLESVGKDYLMFALEDNNALFFVTGSAETQRLSLNEAEAPTVVSTTDPRLFELDGNFTLVHVASGLHITSGTRGALRLRENPTEAVKWCLQGKK